MAIEIRPIVDAELQPYIDAVRRAFGSDEVEGEQDRVTKVMGLDRCHAAFDGDRLVGTIGSYALQLAVPGEVDVPTAGLSRVTVSATHRRQGILTNLMDTHFEHAAANGEAVSILWASEVAIYGRFGYGQAAEGQQLNFDARKARISTPDQPDSLEVIDGDEAAELLPPIREQCRVGRPGKFARSEPWWTIRNLPDPSEFRNGQSARRYVLARRNGEPVGYAMYRHKSHWDDDDLPEGQIHVLELEAVDRQAEHTLWWHLANIDLFPHVHGGLQPTDLFLPWLTTNRRAITRRLTDGIQLRVLDVETALSARRYRGPGELVFELGDDRVPSNAGCFRLRVDDDGLGTCVRTDDAPEVTMDAFALGSLYLGSMPPEPLAFTGRLQSGPAGDGTTPAESCRILDWPIPAWCDEGF